ncbi:ROK family protein [Trueperella pecoris]|uniref:ROK family protein n=1 Tax=Trueperella pecoris TaxID=2733571 RepID=A0A7M1R295_9ACTO|nr:ROK family protein [Trueperella pecoris]QOR47824.1 ROK family protein [Trueperella pecoris]
MSMRVGVDVGGTKIAVGLVSDDGTILRKSTITSAPGSPQSTIADIANEIRALTDAQGLSVSEVDGVGLGFAGTVDSPRGRVRTSANLKWTDVDVCGPLSRILGVPVRIVNDADAAAWGECRFGAARRYSSVVAITVGTGIGGAAIIGGTLLEGRHGLLAEFGHMTLVPDGLPCGCGRFGCWEQYCSGTRLSALAAERLPGTDRGPATGRDAGVAALLGNEVAVGIFEEIGAYLGAGLANLAMAFDPDLFLIGGGVSEAGELLLGPTRREYARQMGLGGFPCADVVPALLGNDAGLIGAADLA